MVGYMHDEAEARLLSRGYTRRGGGAVEQRGTNIHLILIVDSLG